MAWIEKQLSPEEEREADRLEWLYTWIEETVQDQDNHPLLAGRRDTDAV